MPSPSVAVSAVRDLLASTMAASEVSDAERAKLVRRVRDDLADLVGQADRYLGDTDLRREAAAMGRVARLAEARENADIREEAIRRGLATAAELDALGYFSHERLDQLVEDGTLEETLEEAGRAFGLGRLHGTSFNQKVKRDQGRFAHVQGRGAAPEPPKAVRGSRRGTPQPPQATSAQATAAARAAAPKPAAPPAKPTPAPKAAAPRQPKPKAKAKAAKPEAGGSSHDDAIDVGSDVNKAADLLAQGKHVRLDQPRTASTLLDKLASTVKDMEAKGESAPNFDLCKVSVPGTNLFCAESKGIPRVEMPQLGGVPLAGTLANRLPKNDRGRVDLAREFRKSLADDGVKIEQTTEKASFLRASQMELNGAKVASMTQRLKAGGSVGDDAIFVSSDNYIVDGHHRWAATVGHDLADNKAGDLDMGIQRVDLPITDLLDRANSFASEMGIPQAGVTGPRKIEPTAPQRAALDAGELPERGELYFDLDRSRLAQKYGPVKVEDVPLDKIDPIRARPEGIANAKPLMAKAATGEGGRRDPITLVRQGDGRFKVYDGNSTFAIASEAGWGQVPAMVVDSDDEGARLEAIAKTVKAEQKVKAKRIDVDVAMGGMYDEAETEKAVQDFESLDALYAAAEADAPAFEALLTKDLAGALGGQHSEYEDSIDVAQNKPETTQVVIGPLKKRERATEKIETKYDGDHNRLNDVIRGTVVVPTLADMPKMVETLRERAGANGWKIMEAQNRFLDPPPPPPGATGSTPLGYRDAKVMLMSPGGVAAELQFNTSAMYAAKGGEGHTIYEEQRSIEAAVKRREKAALEGRATPGGPTRDEYRKLDALETRSRELYANALTASYG